MLFGIGILLIYLYTSRTHSSLCPLLVGPMQPTNTVFRWSHCLSLFGFVCIWGFTCHLCKCPSFYSVRDSELMHKDGVHGQVRSPFLFVLCWELIDRMPPVHVTSCVPFIKLLSKYGLCSVLLDHCQHSVLVMSQDVTLHRTMLLKYCELFQHVNALSCRLT